MLCCDTGLGEKVNVRPHGRLQYKKKEFSIKIPPHPPYMEKKKNSTFFYVFIIFMITNFGENFEEKIDEKLKSSVF